METQTLAETSSISPVFDKQKRTQRDHLFFSVMAIVCACMIFAGFSRTYYLKSFTGAPPLTPLLHWHAAVFTLWPIFFVAQTLLIAKNRPHIHRRLGAAGVVLALLMIVLGGATAIVSVRLGSRGTPGFESPDPLIFLMLPLRNLVTFGPLFAAAIYYRRQPETHKRLMLLATLGGVVPPAFPRLRLTVGPEVAPAVGVLMLLTILAGPIYDLITTRRIHRAYLLGFAFSLIVGVLLFQIAATDWWHKFARWLILG
jgi:hypothetical protein